MSCTRVMTGIPTAPGALPLLGHLLRFVRDPLGLLRSLPEHGGLVRVHLGPMDAVVVCDPELTHRVLVDDRTFDKGGTRSSASRSWSAAAWATAANPDDGSAIPLSCDPLTRVISQALPSRPGDPTIRALRPVRPWLSATETPSTAMA